MLTLEKMEHDRVQPSQFNENEQSCVKLANPPTQTSNKMENINKNRKNVVSPDPEELDIPTVSKAEVAADRFRHDIKSLE